MKLPKLALALGVMLVLNIVVALLLTPLGFESRPPTALMIVGYVAIGTVFAGIVLDVVAIVFLVRRRIRSASALAIAGSMVFLFPNVVDRAGAFFSLPIPPTINVLEYVFTAVLLITLVLAWQVRRGTGRPGAAE
jgi:hypothetical protein